MIIHLAGSDGPSHLQGQNRYPGNCCHHTLYEDSRCDRLMCVYFLSHYTKNFGNFEIFVNLSLLHMINFSAKNRV